jgi:2-oxoisovalerate dehydrogenase E2 component (dihydrolipoyl transacylase)
MRAKVISNGDDKHLEIRKDGIIGLAVSGMSAILLPTGVCMYSLPRPETRTGHAVPPCSSTIHPFVRDHGTPPRGAEEPDKAWAQCQSRRLVRGRLGRGIRRHARHTPRRTFGDLRSGRARWGVEWKLRDAGMKVDPVEVEQGGTRAVLRCSVGWSGDHRVVS